MTASCTAFSEDRHIATGSPAAVAMILMASNWAEVLIFDDRTGHELDFDLTGTPQEVLDRLAGTTAIGAPDAEAKPEAPPSKPRRGRPKLGVTAREVTLLPRHWDWLSAQKGGSSATLRRLVEAAIKADAGETEARQARNAAYHFMSVMAGNRSGFEEASRALFAGEDPTAMAQTQAWPQDVTAHIRHLLAGALPRTAG